MLVSLSNDISVSSRRNVERRPSQVEKIIQKVALASIGEFVATVFFTGVTCCFVASKAIPTLLLQAIIMFVTTTFFRCYQAHREAVLLQKESSLNAWTRIESKIESVSLEILPKYFFSSFTSTTIDTVVHEAGHALAAEALYKNAFSKIEIFPLKGGVTSFYTGTLSRLGEFFGTRSSRVIVAAAGPAAGIALATAELSGAYQLRKHHPKLSLYLVIMAIQNIVQHVEYALSALWLTKYSSAHDFAYLWKVGQIHPLVSVAAMVAFPILFNAGVIAWTNKSWLD